MTNTPNNAPTSSASRNAKIALPEGIFIPDYMKELLERTDMPQPDKIDNDYLIDIGTKALIEKQRSVEQHNITASGAKRKVPERLSFDDVAIILMSLFTYRNIQLTERVQDALLGIYIQDPNDARFGTYVTNELRTFSIMERLAPSFKKTDMQDVLDKIERSVPTVELTQDRHLFAVNNGVYNQKTQELLPYSPQFIYVTKIPIDYKRNTTPPIYTASDGYKWDVDSWIQDLAIDAETNELIWQVIADSLQPNRSRHKSIWFYSEKGNNGKGTLGQLIKNLLGRGNYASLSVTDFKHEFLKETLIGVAANISDENDVDVFIDSVKDYKASVTGDDININRKHEKPIRMQFTGTNIQMMNGLPKIKDRSDSFYRRIILVPFIKSFTNNGERKYIKDDYIHRKEVLEYVLQKAIRMDFSEFTVPFKSAELIKDYKEMNNPVLEFWNETKDEYVWDLLPTQFLYDVYTRWFERNNPSGKVMSRRTFSDAIATVVHASGDAWEVRMGQGHNVRTGNKMDADEPMITEYGLDRVDRYGNATAWMNPAYTGSNKVQARRFTRKPQYRGLVRIPTNTLAQTTGNTGTDETGE